ncbi:MAG TPA: penicillin-binding protein 2, partial [Casimicrobiaceae bacterium]|nr:penicillin-binding protein 2 [Casimicrobiaceae bacterium]
MPGRLLFTRRRDSSSFGTAELRNPERDLHHFRRRLSLVAALVFIAFCGLFARFFYLQVVQHAHFETLAETNRIAIVPIVPNRGVITDRNGIVLAQSYSAYTLEITPSRVGNLDATIDKLAEIVDIEPRDRKRFRKLLDESKNFESLPIRTKLTDEEVARFAVNRYRFPGVDIKARLFRQYPFGEIASHVVGYIGRINDKDNERIAEWDETANYKGSDYIGKVGVELS